MREVMRGVFAMTSKISRQPPADGRQFAHEDWWIAGSVLIFRPDEDDRPAPTQALQTFLQADKLSVIKGTAIESVNAITTRSDALLNFT